MVAIMASTSLIALAILYFGRKNIKIKVDAGKEGAAVFH